MARPIPDIESDLAAFRALRTKAAISGGIAEYSVDSGQGRQSVRRVTLSEINVTLRVLEAELLDAQTDGGPLSITFDRGAN
jgi:hypothetical protein